MSQLNVLIIYESDDDRIEKTIKISYNSPTNSFIISHETDLLLNSAHTSNVEIIIPSVNSTVSYFKAKFREILYSLSDEILCSSNLFIYIGTNDTISITISDKINVNMNKLNKYIKESNKYQLKLRELAKEIIKQLINDSSEIINDLLNLIIDSYEVKFV